MKDFNKKIEQIRKVIPTLLLLVLDLGSLITVIIIVTYGIISLIQTLF